MNPAIRGVIFNPGMPALFVEVPRLSGSIDFVVQRDRYSCTSDLWILCGSPQSGDPVTAGARCVVPAACHPPGEKTLVERKLSWQVLDPSPAVSRLTHLPLAQLIVLNSRGPEDSGTWVDSIHYVFGQVPPGIDKVGPPRSTPTFMGIAEYRGKQSEGSPFVERAIEHVGATTSSPGRAYLAPWRYQAVLAHRGLTLTVVANVTRPVIEQLGAAIAQALSRTS